MGLTMTEKVLARTAGKASVSVGEIVTVDVDMAVLLDLEFTANSELSQLKKVWDSEKVAIVLDHAIPAPTIETADNLLEARTFAERFNIQHFYKEGRHGISHQLVAELGLALPGSLLVCADSHTSASGAFNCAGRGVGPQEMLYIASKGTSWFIVYPTIKYILEGALPEGVYARDIIHYIAGKYGDHVGKNIEYVGPAVENMDMSERQTIATMSAEVSAEFAMFEADHKTIEYIEARTDKPFSPVFADKHAQYEDVRVIDVAKLEPTVVLPHYVPNNVRTITNLKDKVNIDQAFIGSCANARIEDLRVAAEMLKGKRVHPNIRLIITPSSSEVMKQAAQEGLIEIYIEAGAVMTNATCGACYGGHMGVIGKGETCITSSTRNFKGRMGSPESEVYLASPATVAASAIAGFIQDPRLEQ